MMSFEDKILIKQKLMRM